jgi:hypothetical protein
MAATLIFEDNGLVVAHGSGVLLRTEFDELKKRLVAHITQQGKVNVLIIIGEDFASLESFAEWHDNQDDEFIQQHVKQLAIVGAPEWSEGARLFFLQGLLPFPIQYFTYAEEELARAWLG